MQKNSYPKISTVTPSYNQGKFIEYNIKSVINQKYPNYEHIIIDNCSTDKTIEILKKYPHIKWISEQDKGQSDALNKGLEMATGEIIGWQNADDYYLPSSFHVAVDHLRKNWNSEIVYRDYLWVDVNGKLIQHRKEINFDNFIFEYLHFCYIPSTSTFFRRIIIEEGNYFDVNFHFAMDFEYFLRLYKKNYHFSHINKFISAFRLHDSVKSFVQAEKQKIEHRNALLLHNEGLNKIKLLCGSYMIIGRLLMDRPGSARLGGTGGMRHAIAYSAAVPLFFVADQLAREKLRTRDVLRVIIGFGMAMLLWRIFWRFFSQQQIPLYFGWYEGPLWFLMPLWLALILKRVRQTHMPMLVPIIFCIFFLILSVLSPFRSRIYFAVASFATVFCALAIVDGCLSES